jgi:hypothetical protein
MEVPDLPAGQPTAQMEVPDLPAGQPTAQMEVPDLPAGRPTAQAEQPVEVQAEQPAARAGQPADVQAEQHAEARWDPWRKPERPVAQPAATAPGEQAAGPIGQSAAERAEAQAEQCAAGPWDAWRKAEQPVGQPTATAPDEQAAPYQQPAEPTSRRQNHLASGRKNRRYPYPSSGTKARPAPARRPPGLSGEGSAPPTGHRGPSPGSALAGQDRGGDEYDGDRP